MGRATPRPTMTGGAGRCLPGDRRQRRVEGGGAGHVAPRTHPAGVLRRGVHTSVQALENDIRAWIATWNDNPRPFNWTKTADEILNSLAGYLTKVGTTTQAGKNNSRNFRRGTLAVVC